MDDPDRKAPSLPERALRDADERTLGGRAARLQALVALGEPEEGRLLFGGHLALYAFHEATASYVAGSFLGCILLTQVCLEHTLAGLFSMRGRDDLVTTSYRRMLEAARDLNDISSDEYTLFDRLRDERNPYAHPRLFEDSSNLVRRAIERGADPDSIIESDAIEALFALVRLFNRPPFAVR